VSIDAKPRWTFRGATIAVIALWLVNLSGIVWGTRPSQVSGFVGEYYKKMCWLAHSPLFIVLDFAFVVFGFWIIRRYHSKYYGPCVVFYTLLVANVLGMFDAWVSCYLFFKTPVG
jgi:FtsH-binding integral membrane protein